MEAHIPGYFIDSGNGHFLARDEEGSDLANIEAARREAMLALSEMAKGRFDHGIPSPIVGTTRDETGFVLFEATLTYSERWLVGRPA